MQESHVSVAIIGAGPAGSSTAISALAAGARNITLIDRETFPRDKACGDGLGGGAIPVLKQLGVGHILDGCKRVTRLVTTVGGNISSTLDTTLHERPSPLGYVIPRRVLDHLLVEAAIARGADDLTGWGLASAEWSGGRWNLELKETASGKTRSVTADLLVGADGARSKVRRKLGRAFNSDKHTLVAIRAYVDLDAAKGAYQQFDVLAELPQPGFAWVFADGRGRANIGLGSDVAGFKQEHSNLRRALEHYRQYLDSQITSEPDDIKTAILPIASELPQLAFPDHNAALVGDAASMINPLTGEGIFYGMYAGMILGKRLAHAQQDLVRLPDAVRAYEQEFRDAFAKHFRGTTLLRNFLEFPSLQKSLTQSFNRSVPLFYDYVEYMMGSMPPANAKPLYKLGLDAVLAGYKESRPQPVA